MTATTHIHGTDWARAHLALLAVVVLALALAATVGVLAVRLATGSGAAPTTSTTSIQPLNPVDDRCAMVRAGQAC
jgi:hypothetical protein